MPLAASNECWLFAPTLQASGIRAGSARSNLLPLLERSILFLSFQSRTIVCQPCFQGLRPAQRRGVNRQEGESIRNSTQWNQAVPTWMEGGGQKLRSQSSHWWTGWQIMRQESVCATVRVAKLRVRSCGRWPARPRPPRPPRHGGARGDPGVCGCRVQCRLQPVGYRPCRVTREIAAEESESDVLVDTQARRCYGDVSEREQSGLVTAREEKPPPRAAGGRFMRPRGIAHDLGCNKDARGSGMWVRGLARLPTSGVALADFGSVGCT